MTNTGMTLLSVLAVTLVAQVSSLNLIDIQDTTKSRVSEFYGTDYERLELLRKRILKLSKEKVSLSSLWTRADTCITKLENRKQGRNYFVTCLSKNNPLNTVTYRVISKSRTSLLQKDAYSANVEVQKTVRLLSWLEDVIRTGLYLRAKKHGANLPFAMFETNIANKPDDFSKAKHFSEFDFQNGDIVLTVSNGAISSLIPSVTLPMRRFSHALMVRVEEKNVGFWGNGGKKKEKIVLESLIETGAKRTSWKEFSKRNLFGMMVLRLKEDIPERAAIISAASDYANRFAKERTPYDSAMDMSDTNALFCSELIAESYARAVKDIIRFEDGSAMSSSDILPRASKILGGYIGAFLRSIGVKNKSMVAPGDLISSAYLNVVADYRNVSQIHQFYEHLSFMDVFLKNLGKGYKVFVPSGYDVIKRTAIYLGQPLKKYITRYKWDLGILPTTMTPDEIAMISVFQGEIFKTVIDKYRNQYRVAGQNILENPHWHFIDTLEYILLNEVHIKKFFK